MMSTDLSRRAVLAGAAGGLAMSATGAAGAEPKPAFGYCLNTSTVRDRDGKSRPITELIEIASKAGYDAVEPWTSENDAYLKGGGTLKELRKRFVDAGLKVPDVIGFAEWVVEEPERREVILRERAEVRRHLRGPAEFGFARPEFRREVGLIPRVSRKGGRDRGRADPGYADAEVVVFGLHAGTLSRDCGSGVAPL